MNFSEVLINFRAKHHLSQKELASILGVRQADVSRYEAGKREPTRRNSIILQNKMSEYDERSKRK